MAQTNWRQHVRSRLPALHVSAERESEIVEELAVQLETIYERARARGVADEEAMRIATAEVPDWAAFARTARPDNPAIPQWPAYTTDRRATMLFDTRCRVVDDPGREARLLWSRVATRA